jgi:hypothetical protein
MTCVLHIFTQPDDSLAQKIIAQQKSAPGLKVEIVDLRLPEPDYKDLLGKIFAADSVECW